jgi:predicted RNA binding protein YcfA (HicA-like mRNA interferase family)
MLEMPPKVRELETRLRRAGFVREAARGSHRKWTHPTGRFVVMSGQEGDDAKRYQTEQVDQAIAFVEGRTKA